MFPASLYPLSVFPSPLFPGAGKNSPTPIPPIIPTGIVTLYPASLFPPSLFPPSMYMGTGGETEAIVIPGGSPRYQRGMLIPIGIIVPSNTDMLPVAIIQSTGAYHVATILLPYVPALAPSAYRAFFRLPGGIPLGTYQVTYSYAINGSSGSAMEFFTLVPGGDSGGEIIGLFGYDRPEGRYILAQLGSGRLVQGRDPYL